MGTNTPSTISVLDSSSDDDVYAGKVTLREVRKVLFMSRRTMSAITLSDDEEDEEGDTPRKLASESSSVELIDDVSEPDLISLSSLHITPSKEQMQAQIPRLRRSVSQPGLGYSSPRPDYRESFVPKMHPRLVSDDSFCVMEAAAASASDLSDADFISHYSSKYSTSLKEINTTNTNSMQCTPVTQTEKEKVPETTMKKVLHNSDVPKTQTSNRSGYKKPLLDTVAMDDAIKAFQSKIKLSKTPNAPKSTTLAQKTTPFRSQSLKKFGHILSPVGFFIKNSPHTPLVKTVRPGKPCTGSSAIPKYVGMAKSKQTNENVCPNLPPKAYVSAKTTKTIVIPSTKQLPKNNQVQKMASLLTQPTVIRHERREKCANSSFLQPGPNESWAGLPASQADLSVRVVKVAAVADTLKKK